MLTKTQNPCSYHWGYCNSNSNRVKNHRQKKCKITTKKPSSFNQTMNSFKLFAKSLFAPVE